MSLTVTPLTLTTTVTPATATPASVTSVNCDGDVCGVSDRVICVRDADDCYVDGCEFDDDRDDDDDPDVDDDDARLT